MRSRLLHFYVVLAASTFTPTALNALPDELHSFPVGQFVTTFGAVQKVSDSVDGVPRNVALDIARRIARIDRVRSRLADDAGFLRAADDRTLLLLFNRVEGKTELLRGYGTSLAGKEAPSGMFAQLDLALDSLWLEIRRLAPTFEITPGHPLMRTVVGAIEQRLRVAVPRATFVGGMLREKQWKLRTGALGIPESRLMTGVIFYRLPDQPWIICREFELAQKYFNRTDASTGPGEVTLGSLRIQGDV